MLTVRSALRLASGLVPLLLLAPLGGCAASHASAPSSGTSRADVHELLQADEQFERDVQQQGLEGWMKWYADDAVRMEIDGYVARGAAEIRAHDGPLFADPTLGIHWHPVEGGLEADGRHGWTRGTFVLQRAGANGAVPALVARGHYLTIWRRDAAGWRVVLDTGVNESGAVPAPTGE